MVVFKICSSFHNSVICIAENPILAMVLKMAHIAFIKVRRQFNIESLMLSSAGYSVLEERKLLSHDDYTVVTGSPRAESKGAVMLGRKMAKEVIEVALIIPGEQVGSYFGNSLAITDLNNDGYASAH